MHQIELMIHKYLEDVKAGKAQFNEGLVNKFSDDCRQSLIRQIHREPKDGFTIRMSNIGKPICQLKMEKLYGNSSESNNICKFVFGDMTEKLFTFFIRAAGINVISEQEEVMLNIGEHSVSGTMDLVLDVGYGPEIWDIKSTSEYSYKNKIDIQFDELYKDDPFGMVSQLLGYSIAKKIPAGGFIFINKSSGDFCIFSFPKDQDKYKEEFKQRTEKKIEALINNTEFERSFSDIPETFYKKETGNRILGITCSFCDFKFKCWPELQLLQQKISKSKNPKMFYYTKIEENM